MSCACVETDTFRLMICTVLLLDLFDCHMGLRFFDII